jgi:hypothetical protein
MVYISIVIRPNDKEQKKSGNRSPLGKAVFAGGLVRSSSPSLSASILKMDKSAYGGFFILALPHAKFA